jgi:hypothetical protein
LGADTGDLFQRISCQFSREARKYPAPGPLEKSILVRAAGKDEAASKDIPPPELKGPVPGAVGFSEYVFKIPEAE